MELQVRSKKIWSRWHNTHDVGCKVSSAHDDELRVVLQGYADRGIKSYAMILSKLQKEYPEKFVMGYVNIMTTCLFQWEDIPCCHIQKIYARKEDEGIEYSDSTQTKLSNDR